MPGLLPFLDLERSEKSGDEILTLNSPIVGCRGMLQQNLKPQERNFRRTVWCDLFWRGHQEMASETAWNRWLLSSRAISRGYSQGILVRVYWLKSWLLKGFTTIGLGLTNHIGYDHLNEGWQFFKRREGRWRFWYPIWMIQRDYHIPVVAVAHIRVYFGKEIVVGSVHLSWWDKGFQFEWPLHWELLQPGRQTPLF